MIIDQAAASFGDIGATLAEVRVVPHSHLTRGGNNFRLVPLADIRQQTFGAPGSWKGKHMTFDLTSNKVRFIISVSISVVLTVIAIVIQYVHITGEATHGGFEILLVGYLVLLAGSLLRGV